MLLRSQSVARLEVIWNGNIACDCRTATCFVTCDRVIPCLRPCPCPIKYQILQFWESTEASERACNAIEAGEQ